MTTGTGQVPSFRQVGRSAAVLTGGTALAQVIGIGRELYLAANVGVSAELDALIIAMYVPITLAGAVMTGTVRSLVPAYMEAADMEGRAEARRLAGTVVAWTSVAGIAMWLALAACAGAVVAIAGPGLSPAGQREAVGYLQLLAPGALLAALNVILFAVLQAEEAFAEISLATITGPLVTLGTMLALWQTLGLGALAVGSLAGPLASLAIMILGCLRRSALPFPIPHRDPRITAMIRHAAPITLGTAILQINVIGDRAIASLLGPGAVSALRYADVLVRTPIAAIGPAWGSVIYPALVRSTLSGATASLAATSERALRLLIAIFVPIAMLTAAVAPLAVTAAFGRGAFSSEDVSLTWPVVVGFAPLLLILMVVTVLTGAHNSRRRGVLLMVGGLINVALNITLDVGLGWWIGVMGIAFASSIAQGVVAWFFLVRLAHSDDGFDLTPVARTLLLALLSSLPVTLIAGLLAWGGWLGAGDPIVAIAALAIVGVLGGPVYLLVGSILGMEEPRQVATFITSRFAFGRG